MMVFFYNTLISVKIAALANTGSTTNFVKACSAKHLRLLIAPASEVMQMVNSSKSVVPNLGSTDSLRIREIVPWGQ